MARSTYALLGRLCAAALGGVLTAACAEVNCTSDARSALRVMVVDATGGPVCGATVVVRDGSYVSELMQINCVYFGAHERAGTYSIDVTTASATKTIDGVKVSKDACHVITRELTINMDR